MIHIVSQDALHQYDNFGRAITTWHEKKCAWIVEPEFEKENIDWWGIDNDFPRGQTLEEFEESNPGWENWPDIEVMWTYNENDYKLQFPDWYLFNLPKFPITYKQTWGYLDYSKQEAMERLGKYCTFNEHATNVKITYNKEIIHDGKLN